MHVETAILIGFSYLNLPLTFFPVVDRANWQHRLCDDVFGERQPATNPHNSIDADGVGVSSARSHHHQSSTSAKSNDVRRYGCDATNRHRAITGATQRQCQREVPQVPHEFDRSVEAGTGAGGDERKDFDSGACRRECRA